MNEDKVLQKLVEHDERFNSLEKNLKQEISNTKSEILGHLDGAMVVLKKLDEERVMQHARVDRLETKVEQHDKDIKDLKQNLKTA